MVRVSASCKLQQRTVLPPKLMEEEPLALVTLSLPVLYNFRLMHRQLEDMVKETNIAEIPSTEESMYSLRNRKHVPCFYQVIQTRVEVWENEKCCQWEHELQASVSTAFSSSPKLSRVFV